MAGTSRGPNAEIATADGTLLDEISATLSRRQPEMSVARIGDAISATGRFVVFSPDGEPFDSFEVEMQVPPGFPLVEPRVFEVGGRIERIVDNHVFPSDGSCCVGVWEAWLLKAGTGVSFDRYLSEPVHDYFVGQHHALKGRPWPFGERNHGRAGVVEAYADVLGIENDEHVVIEYLRSIAKASLKGHAACPCGSGRRLRDCHHERLRALRTAVPSEFALIMLRNLEPEEAERRLKLRPPRRALSA